MAILTEFSVVAVKGAAVESLPQSLDRRSRQQLRDREGQKVLTARRHVDADMEVCGPRNSGLRAHGGEQARDDRFRVDPFGFGLEVHEQAMAQHRRRHRVNVVQRHRWATMQYGSRLAREQQRLPGARSSSPAHPLTHELRRLPPSPPDGRLARTRRAA